MMQIISRFIASKIGNAHQVARASSKVTTPGEQLLEPEWRLAESAILPITCFVLPIVMGSIASYMHYCDPAWRQTHRHAPASIRIAHPP